jgi:photosystem II stability/assembly factor-like uncharacterized protein
VSTYTSSTPAILDGGSSCPTTDDCWAAGSILGPTATATYDPGQGYIMATTDGGRTWSSETLPTVDGSPLPYIGSISCPTINGCLALSAITDSSGQQQSEVLSNEATSSS